MKRRAQNRRLIPVLMDTRIVAVQIDFLSLSVVFGLPLVVMEDLHIADGILEFIFCIIFAIFSIYYWIANRFFEGSIGQRLLGYKVVPMANEKPRYLLRFLFGSIAFLLWFFTWLANRHIKDGIYWWDVKSNTRAVPLACKGPYGP